MTPPGVAPKDRDEALKDIERSTSGSSTRSSATSQATPGRHRRRVVLVVRGDLLKRYPNTIIYAQRAHGAPIRRGRTTSRSSTRPAR